MPVKKPRTVWMLENTDCFIHDDRTGLAFGVVHLTKKSAVEALGYAKGKIVKFTEVVDTKSF